MATNSLKLRNNFGITEETVFYGYSHWVLYSHRGAPERKIIKNAAKNNSNIKNFLQEACSHGSHGTDLYDVHWLNDRFLTVQFEYTKPYDVYTKMTNKKYRDEYFVFTYDTPARHGEHYIPQPRSEIVREVNKAEDYFVTTDYEGLNRKTFKISKVTSFSRGLEYPQLVEFKFTPKGSSLLLTYKSIAITEVSDEYNPWNKSKRVDALG